MRFRFSLAFSAIVVLSAVIATGSLLCRRSRSRRRNSSRTTRWRATCRTRRAGMHRCRRAMRRSSPVRPSSATASFPTRRAEGCDVRTPLLKDLDLSAFTISAQFFIPRMTDTGEPGLRRWRPVRWVYVDCGGRPRPAGLQQQPVRRVHGQVSKRCLARGDDHLRWPDRDALSRWRRRLQRDGCAADEQREDGAADELRQRLGVLRHAAGSEDLQRRRRAIPKDTAVPDTLPGAAADQSCARRSLAHEVSDPRGPEVGGFRPEAQFRYGPDAGRTTGVHGSGRFARSRRP